MNVQYNTSSSLLSASRNSSHVLIWRVCLSLGCGRTWRTIWSDGQKDKITARNDYHDDASSCQKFNKWLFFYFLLLVLALVHVTHDEICEKVSLPFSPLGPLCDGSETLFGTFASPSGTMGGNRGIFDSKYDSNAYHDLLEQAAAVVLTSSTFILFAVTLKNVS